MHRFFILLGLLMVVLCPSAMGEEKPVRLHVIAENDTLYAQEIKLKVKDAVFTKAAQITKDAENARTAYAKLCASQGELRLTAREAALKAGYTGEIDTEVTHEYFPARLYGDLIVKEGRYPTVLVRIGQAEGKNWWCVIYPDLCLYGQRTDADDIQFYSKFGYWFKKIMLRWSV
ncbi:MAG: stage II sporulation protein R [Clostridia bacterium]|nr:stage II sporulation protein R [Clostridia bacterium]